MERFSPYGQDLESRMLLGTAQYPSPRILQEAITGSGCAAITVSLRRESLSITDAASMQGQGFWALIQELGKPILPNTAGCQTAREAVTTAHMARELFNTDWIKLEVIADPDLLVPEVFGLVEAAQILVREGFKVFPYTTEDLGVAEKLLGAGCEVLMPWGAPIGSGQGLNNLPGLKAMRARLPDVPLVIDAGLGLPSHAAAAMELGFDAVLLNTAVARADDPIAMACAFARAVEAGHAAYSAGPMPQRDMAAPSTPEFGLALL